MSFGGALGSLTRWGISELLGQGRSATLIANLVGVGLASFLLVFLERKGTEITRHLFLPGFCGGLTTFSALAFMTLQPSEGGAAYFLMTLFASLLIVACVIPISRKIVTVGK